MSKRIEFIALALCSNTDECIIWPFAIRKSSGYGAHSEGSGNNKKNHDIHRYVCVQAHGQPEIGEEAAHQCGNRLCINFRHLYWATHLENMKDAKKHGTPVGGGRYRQKIFAYDRAMIKASKDSLLTLAGRYGMDPAYMGRLKRLPVQFDL